MILPMLSPSQSVSPASRFVNSNAYAFGNNFEKCVAPHLLHGNNTQFACDFHFSYGMPATCIYFYKIKRIKENSMKKVVFRFEILLNGNFPNHTRSNFERIFKANGCICPIVTRKIVFLDKKLKTIFSILFLHKSEA